MFNVDCRLFAIKCMLLLDIHSSYCPRLYFANKCIICATAAREQSPEIVAIFVLYIIIMYLLCILMHFASYIFSFVHEYYLNVRVFWEWCDIIFWHNPFVLFLSNNFLILMLLTFNLNICAHCASLCRMYCTTV